MSDSTTETQTVETLGGLRMTKQRRVVYDVVRELATDHPTASEVYSSAKEKMPTISLATVYNCLETLTHAGAVTQVNIDREASRFCPNLQPHAHFFCSRCDSVFDVELRKSADVSSPWNLPDGSSIEGFNVAIRGTCPNCNED